MTVATLFPNPTSVIICGSSRPLLNWVAFALASASDPAFHWTDVRITGEVPTPDDLFSRDRIPPERLHLVAPRELTPDDATANVAVSAVIRDEETPEELRRVVEFLRLPHATQQLLAETESVGSPRVVVLSNGHRLLALYPEVGVVAPTVRAIVSARVVFIMTFADAPPGGRVAFDTVLHLEGHDPKIWRQSKLRVEKAPSTSEFRSGSEVRLADFEPVAAVLSREFL